MSVEIVGPFEHYDLLVDGRRVPLMQARELDGGQIDLTFDRRLALTVSARDFDAAARFIAGVIEGVDVLANGVLPFNRVHEITSTHGAEPDRAERLSDG